MQRCPPGRPPPFSLTRRSMQLTASPRARPFNLPPNFTVWRYPACHPSGTHPLSTHTTVLLCRPECTRPNLCRSHQQQALAHPGHFTTTRVQRATSAPPNRGSSRPTHRGAQPFTCPPTRADLPACLHGSSACPATCGSAACLRFVLPPTCLCSSAQHFVQPVNSASCFGLSHLLALRLHLMHPTYNSLTSLSSPLDLKTSL